MYRCQRLTDFMKVMNHYLKLKKKSALQVRVDLRDRLLVENQLLRIKVKLTSKHFLQYRASEIRLNEPIRSFIFYEKNKIDNNNKQRREGQNNLSKILIKSNGFISIAP